MTLFFGIVFCTFKFGWPWSFFLLTAFLMSFISVCNHLADTGMFIDNSNVTSMDDLNEMKGFAKGLAIAFKTEGKDVQMGIIAGGMRSRIPGIHGKRRPRSQTRKRITPPENRHRTQARKMKIRPKANVAIHPKTGFFNQAFKWPPPRRTKSPFHPQRGHQTQAFKRAEAYLLLKQKMPLPPLLNDVLFVLVSGAESDVEVHAPVKELKDAGAKIVAIAVGKDGKIGKLGDDADKKFSVPPGAGNAIVNVIVLAVCKPGE